MTNSNALLANPATYKKAMASPLEVSHVDRSLAESRRRVMNRKDCAAEQGLCERGWCSKDKTARDAVVIRATTVVGMVNFEALSWTGSDA